MNLRFFIDRPIFSIVISVTIVLLGVIALTTLPVEQYPDIAPPTVQVTTSYPGANAETVQKAVIVPLEEAINGVENMSYIHSEASNTGEVTVNVYFRQGVDADMAAVNVQNRVSKAQGLLPAEVTKIGVQTLKQQKSLIQAAVGAAKVRLRPILMTALTMVFGLLPLMVSTGVGANGNRTLGSGAVGGMLVGTLALLFIVPVLFVAFQWLQEKIRPIQFEQAEEWSIRAEVEDLKNRKEKQ